MGFLSKITEKVSDLFGRVASASQKVEGIGAQIVICEGIREDLQAQKAAAYSRLLDFREQELDGKPDPDGLAAARAQCADLDEKLDAASRKILRLHDEFAAAASDEILIRHETAQERLDAMEDERRKAFPAMTQALAQAVALRDRYWSVGRDRPFDFSMRSLPGFDKELARLQAEKSGLDFLAALIEVREDIKRAPGTQDNINYVFVRTKSLLKRLRGAA